MKKIAALVLVVCMTCASVFALDFGAGGMFDFTHEHAYAKATLGPVTTTSSGDISLIGFKGFFDAQYAVASFGINTNITKQKITSGSTSTLTDLTIRYFNIGLLAKYPIELGSIQIFPLVGVDWDIIISYQKNNTNYKIDSAAREEFNALWLDLGVGADIPLGSGALYLRPQGIFGIQLNTPASVKQQKKQAEALGGKLSAGTLKFNIGLGLIRKF
ncbi:hypothetical protein HMPREF9194_01401 [Treponema maltophilum ATCC 51939]|uniref:Outer membrane protein beta-barrel domain-containing protein n=1 Tax=Treponema maltophilum ATCC 51939 TaxID=1125699 RepID=S3K2B9_TREMA|nr:hypothetical protein [Treponema maltophilum]EPF31071.1 hypothetical protein HMPREF9194_01401 [Treponema maltophilum ATCC 51939]